MASLGQIIFCSMMTLIVVFSAIIILILALAFSKSSSDVVSGDPAPVANLGGDQLLSCYLHTRNGEARLSRVSVTWARKDPEGLVYRYKDGAPDLGGQDFEFAGRTQLFPDALVAGNASLLMRGVRRSDAGEYTCSIGSSEGGGEVNIRLRTAAFSAPAFTFSDGVLAAKASRWFPRPNVTWLDGGGDALLGSTNFSRGSGGVYAVVSALHPVNLSSTYTCRIENDLVTSVSEATVTGSGVVEKTYFTFSSTPSLQTSAHLIFTTSVLCICCLT